MIVQHALQHAIESLYAVFARYPRPDVVDGCYHCVSVEDKAKLNAHPLRELGDEELGRYSTKALTTWGEVDDLRHFLPRIFELVAEGSYGANPEIVIGKLAIGEWKTWPPDEQQALRAFIDAWLDEALDMPPDEREALEVIASAHAADMDLAPLLARWEERATKSLEARAQLLDLVRTASAAHERGDPLNPWMSGGASSEVTSWLARIDSSLLERAIEEAPEREREWHREILAQFRAHASR